MPVTVLISLDNPVFRSFAYYISILLLKTVAMSIVTGMYRVARKKFRHPEDYMGSRQAPTGPQSDPDIERLVSIHANDIENIAPFVITGVLYILTEPNAILATWYFRVYTISRLLHTVAFFFALQPFRTITFGVSITVHLLMLFSIIFHLM